MSNTTTKKAPPAVWRFFRSVRLTIVLLILVAASSIIGTLIPQVSQRESLEFARGLSPEVFRLFRALDLFDMYHSLWFRLLLGCLALNLIICSVDRFPRTWKLFRTKPRPDRNKPFEALPPEQTFSVQETMDKASDRIQPFLKRRYKKVTAKTTADIRHFYAEKGRYCRFGVYLVHVSVLLILIGALAGSFFGFQGYVNILENEQTQTITLRKSRDRMELGFAVRCNRFKVEFYDDGTPREFRSDLTFLVEGEPVEEKSVRVNHPVSFKGIVFYQSQWGSVPGNTVHMRIQPNSGPVEMEAGEFYPLPGEQGAFAVTDIKNDFMGMGPAVRIEIRPPQDHADKADKKEIWILKNYEKIKNHLPGPMLLSEKFNPSAYEPFTFLLDDVESIYYTGLQVNRDPGVPIVWAGCFLMIVGFFVTFFMSHVRIWVRISAGDRKNHIAAAGASNRNPVGLERELTQLVRGLRNLFDKKGQ